MNPKRAVTPPGHAIRQGPKPRHPNPILITVFACMVSSTVHHTVSAWFFEYDYHDPANNYYRLLYWFSISILLLVGVRLNLGILRMPALVTTYHLIFLNVLIRNETISLVPANYVVCVATTIFTYFYVSLFAFIMLRR